MGIMTITADSELKRTYTWEGASRSATLEPRTERWYGSLGAYNPGMGDMWVEHNGITRGVLQEGQQHFKSEQEATEWLQNQCAGYATVYRDDGLVVSFDKFPERSQINVEVWQIFINGAKPHKLQASKNNNIKITKANNQ